MAAIGDRVQVPSRKVGGAPRDGVVTGVTGVLLRVRWSTGEESTLAPSMGSLEVVGKAVPKSGGTARGRQTKSDPKRRVEVPTAPKHVVASKQAKKAVKPGRGAPTTKRAAKKGGNG